MFLWNTYNITIIKKGDYMKNGKIAAVMLLLVGSSLMIAEPNYRLSLDAVARGALPGDYAVQEYASKVRDIMDYDYSQALGKANLYERLQQQLANFNNTQDLVTFKKSIDILHAMLQTYSRGMMESSQDPLSLDAILAGSLGNDYAQKCQLIMTDRSRAQMLQNYVDSWQKSNGTIEFKKTMLKRNIDNLYYIAQKGQ
jgi:hypothetical protein